MIDKVIYNKLRESFGNFVIRIQQIAGSDDAKKSLDVISDTLKKINTFYDSDAAAGHTLQRSLNGKADMVSADAISQLSEGMKLFFEKIPPDERKNLIRNLMLSIGTQHLRRIASNLERNPGLREIAVK
ncbi:hypothetical protein L0156_02340 [bacterium]|nr:hypothetical protein [bacterium]